jgi:hypothetical protein
VLGVRTRNSPIHSAFIGHFIRNLRSRLPAFSRLLHRGDRDVLEIGIACLLSGEPPALNTLRLRAASFVPTPASDRRHAVEPWPFPTSLNRGATSETRLWSRASPHSSAFQAPQPGRGTRSRSIFRWSCIGSNRENDRPELPGRLNCSSLWGFPRIAARNRVSTCISLVLAAR